MNEISLKNPMKTFFLPVFILFFYVLGVKSLSCYKNSSFNYKTPGETVEECTDPQVCVRFVVIKDGQSRKDTIGCGLTETCTKAGEAAKTADADVVFHCIECKEDKCIPKSPSDGAKEEFRSSASPEVVKTSAAAAVKTTGLRSDSTNGNGIKTSYDRDAYPWSPPPTTTINYLRTTHEDKEDKDKKHIWDDVPEVATVPTALKSIIFLCVVITFKMK